MKRALLRTLAVIFVFCALISLTGAMVVTQENEYKLIRQFGRIERIISTAGCDY